MTTSIFRFLNIIVAVLLAGVSFGIWWVFHKMRTFAELAALVLVTWTSIKRA